MVQSGPQLLLGHGSVMLAGATRSEGAEVRGLLHARISERLASEKHAEFCEGLEKLGMLLAYHASRPKYKAATDNRWRGTFGNVREVLTFEAKVEQADGKEVTPAFVGQGHNQMNRAIAEYQQLGYTVCGTIVTHLDAIDASA